MFDEISPQGTDLKKKNQEAVKTIKAWVSV